MADLRVQDFVAEPVIRQRSPGSDEDGAHELGFGRDGPINGKLLVTGLCAGEVNVGEMFFQLGKYPGAGGTATLAVKRLAGFLGIFADEIDLQVVAGGHAGFEQEHSTAAFGHEGNGNVRLAEVVKQAVAVNDVELLITFEARGFQVERLQGDFGVALAEEFEVFSANFGDEHFAAAVEEKMGVLAGAGADFEHGLAGNGQPEAGEMFLPPRIYADAIE